MTAKDYSGSCLCGAVTFSVRPPMRELIACHCKQCRITTGLYVAATSCETSQMTLNGTENITWYNSSPGCRRGFCRTCGSQLFWERIDSGMRSVMVGCIQEPHDLKIAKHIYVDSKPDYYQIEDSKPQFKLRDDSISQG